MLEIIHEHEIPHNIIKWVGEEGEIIEILYMIGLSHKTVTMLKAFMLCQTSEHSYSSYIYTITVSYLINNNCPHTLF